MMHGLKTIHSCKSLSTSSAGSVSGSNVGSEVGSAVSSGVHSAGHVSLVRSAHSDPLSDKKKSFNLPWRRVVARMKKKSSAKESFDGNSNSFKRSLSGRENPARPNLSEDESSPVNELKEQLPVAVVPAANNNVVVSPPRARDAEAAAGDGELSRDMPNLILGREDDASSLKKPASNPVAAVKSGESSNGSSASSGSKKTCSESTYCPLLF